MRQEGHLGGTRRDTNRGAGYAGENFRPRISGLVNRVGRFIARLVWPATSLRASCAKKLELQTKEDFGLVLWMVELDFPLSLRLFS